MVLSKSRDLWFALISVGPDAAQFFLVNSAVFCPFSSRLICLNNVRIPHPHNQFQMLRYNSEKRPVTACIDPKQEVSRDGSSWSATGTCGVIRTC
jgi:hypothetical protein